MEHSQPVFTLEQLEEEEKLEFLSFSNDDAFDLGTIATSVIREWNLSLAVDIVIGDDQVYRANLKNTDKGNNAWLTGKAAVARDFRASSLLVRFRHEAAGTKFSDLDVDHELYKAHGGSVPIRVNGEIIGTITLSGEPDVVDHEVAVEAIRRFLAR